VDRIRHGAFDGPGAFFKPTVITDITPEMRVYSDEAFGPLAMIYRVPFRHGLVCEYQTYGMA
jgi:acyl-CoA reductase-like NAD-dependent aldehyde dehydrogenase